MAYCTNHHRYHDWIEVCPECRSERALGGVAADCSPPPAYKADFLWGFDEGSIEEAGYEFANAINEEYRKVWWENLKDRIRAENDKAEPRRPQS